MECYEGNRTGGIRFDDRCARVKTELARSGGVRPSGGACLSILRLPSQTTGLNSSGVHTKAMLLLLSTNNRSVKAYIRSQT